MWMTEDYAIDCLKRSCTTTGLLVVAAASVSWKSSVVWMFEHMQEGMLELTHVLLKNTRVSIALYSAIVITNINTCTDQAQGSALHTYSNVVQQCCVGASQDSKEEGHHKEASVLDQPAAKGVYSGHSHPVA
eukprot:4878-Heterococcus_DN1.PRE.1